MSPANKRNMGHSVFQRLLNIARREKQDLNLLLLRYGMERFLYRLSVSPHRDQFVLKGASMFLVWKGKNFRVTRDVDLLGFGAPDVENIARVFSEICREDLEAQDGMVYLAATLNAAAIREEQEYDGVRVTFEGRLHTARIPLQIDIGFGDAITPGPETVVFPPLLDTPPATLKAYPRYTMVAEKLEAMVRLGLPNSRMKDFYDVCLLSQMFEFEGSVLREAIANTFNRRATALPEAEPFAFSETFFMDNQKRILWEAFVTKTQPIEPSEDLGGAIRQIARFIMPPLRSLQCGTLFPLMWIPENGWQ